MIKSNYFEYLIDIWLEDKTFILDYTKEIDTRTINILYEIDMKRGKIK